MIHCGGLENNHKKEHFRETILFRTQSPAMHCFPDWNVSSHSWACCSVLRPLDTEVVSRRHRILCAGQVLQKSIRDDDNDQTSTSSQTIQMPNQRKDRNCVRRHQLRQHPSADGEGCTSQSSPNWAWSTNATAARELVQARRRQKPRQRQSSLRTHCSRFKCCAGMPA